MKKRPKKQKVFNKNRTVNKADLVIPPFDTPSKNGVYSKFFSIKNIWTYIISFISGGLTLVGIIDLMPQIDINTVTTLDPKYPFSTLFEIHNGSKFSINHINYTCYIDSLVTTDTLTNKLYSSMENINMDLNLEEIPEISSGDAVTERFPLEDITKISIGGPSSISYVDIYFMYTFKYLFVTFKRRFRFVGIINKQRNFIWTKQRDLLPEYFNIQEVPLLINSHPGYGNKPKKRLIQ